jgi:hypothetical protein
MEKRPSSNSDLGMKLDSKSDLSVISYAGSAIANIAPNIGSGAKTLPNKGNTLISS